MVTMMETKSGADEEEEEEEEEEEKKRVVLTKLGYHRNCCTF